MGVDDPLFDLDEYLSVAPPSGLRTRGHVWTENKAKLIARYLRSFTYVTKHGTYLDAFAGAQEGDDPSPNSWAAKLVMENEPKWMRKFALFEIENSKIGPLEELAQSQRVSEGKLKRAVSVTQGDSNVTLPTYLEENPIADREASFCLLDQRTKECSWRLVESIATHKRGGCKIELFYFLAQGWVDRVLTDKIGEGNVTNVCEWLGHDDWKIFKALGSRERAQYFVTRFKNDLGYKHAKPFPIFEKGNEGKIMFWMIHASDHDRAIPLMETAYTGVGLSLPPEPLEQLDFLVEEEFECRPKS